ncbi:hypothetical protein AVEN_207957-1 [Araneus ventricosus]|uniref:Uncharacterized protein n=1 Tax=Araneus ventricosus TaxID=182803 RepID=A0A4Y2PCB6_ARAVE|nr:hypothetical protein AVEN_30166-1 [Araneus ventricosus]GBN49034.1 hypothetical protein AVEN_251252-1 [Araneus ventricosus]GBN49096.1 hypothetical protein AVEN_207957-1 [Araneus ventricosus]
MEEIEYDRFNPLIPKAIGIEEPQNTGAPELLYRRYGKFTSSPQKPQLQVAQNTGAPELLYRRYGEFTSSPQKPQIQLALSEF